MQVIRALLAPTESNGLSYAGAAFIALRGDERSNDWRFRMHVIAMDMLDTGAKVFLISLVCAFVCYWLLR